MRCAGIGQGMRADAPHPLFCMKGGGGVRVTPPFRRTPRIGRLGGTLVRIVPEFFSLFFYPLDCNFSEWGLRREREPGGERGPVRADIPDASGRGGGTVAPASWCCRNYFDAGKREKMVG